MYHVDYNPIQSLFIDSIFILNNNVLAVTQ